MMEMPEVSFAVVSAEKSHLSRAENADRGAQLALCLRSLGMPFEMAWGFYGGSSEVSLVVPTHGTGAMPICRVMGLMFDQDSILVVDHVGDAHLLHLPSLRKEPLGMWFEITPEELDRYSAWTSVGGKFYTTKGALIIGVQNAA